MARPSEYDFELCKKICDEVANGENIISVLKESTYPSWSTFRRWKNENDELRTLYVNSQQDKGIALENEIDDVMQSLKAGDMEASVGNVLIQTLKWKMAKFYPKMFGDKLDVEANGNLNITWNEEKTYE
ncbi:terminase small subunit-like protein [Chryseobacterium aureum]|uniref:terminase small subunit-like protein n=1 Tax=Chryseobacterium aureum TaxID=2497456 RepID=UPI000F878211|nr:hypothetical protein [Chryseobacterium aureum]